MLYVSYRTMKSTWHSKSHKWMLYMLGRLLPSSRDLETPVKLVSHTYMENEEMFPLTTSKYQRILGWPWSHTLGLSRNRSNLVVGNIAAGLIKSSSCREE